VSDAHVTTAGPKDADSCLAALTLAFAGDPPCRWAWPDSRQYLQAFPRFARAFGGMAFDRGTVHYYAGFTGAALWLPPGSAPDEAALVALIVETVEPRRQQAMFSMFEQMDAFHPREEHWHLPLIGVQPSQQGRGIGAALLKHALKRCDEQRLPAYLEATSPRNVPFYEKHGFAALGCIQVADAPPIVPMLRGPQS
jgi:GNAT superfamily N-acetyltransferase